MSFQSNISALATRIRDEFNTLRGNLSVYGSSGWADYADTQYTDVSPFTLTVAGGKTDLPNNAGAGVTSQTPADLTNMYDGTTIQGVNGDAYTLTMEFSVRPTTNTANVRIVTSIDIGGAVGEIYPRDFSLTKGNGVEHFYLSSFTFYTLDTFEANGGTVKVQAINSDVEIYNIRYVIVRVHKANSSTQGAFEDFVRNTEQSSFTGDAVTQIVRCTQAEYDALTPPDPNTLYLVPE